MKKREKRYVNKSSIVIFVILFLIILLFIQISYGKLSVLQRGVHDNNIIVNDNDIDDTVNNNTDNVNSNDRSNNYSNDVNNSGHNNVTNNNGNSDSNEINSLEIDNFEIPKYNNKNYVILNSNVPYFTEDDKRKSTFESYSELDSLGRCGVAFANISRMLMPTEKRGSIGSVKPSGWHTVKYDIVSGKYLYNRCHLIGYQLTAENANSRNLITCTRQMNTTAMLEFENMVANYIKNTNNHVLYRVTPIFEDDNLLATGVIMEAYSIEDSGRGIKFNVFVYNVQDGIEIDYKTGDSKLR